MLKTSKLIKAGGGKSHDLRASNIEALRIIAMSMILIWHFLIHGMTPTVFKEFGMGPVYHILSGYVLSGVDIFFMISGYFTIKFSLQKLLTFILNILAFGLINLFLEEIVLTDVPVSSIIATILFPVSGSPYWFLKVYLLLMITAPLLNVGLKTIPIGQLKKILILIVLALAYMHGHHASYNYLNGLLFYCLGYYCRHASIGANIKKRWLLLTFFASCSICIIVNYCVNNYLSKMHGEFSDYENIFAVISAVSLFLFFTKVEIKSKTINIIAGACLGCYMLQDGRFGYTCLYKWQVDFFKTHGLSYLTLFMLVISFIGIWIASLIFTRINDRWTKKLSASIVSNTNAIKTSLSNKLSQ